jgi:hypothetical protein
MVDLYSRDLLSEPLRHLGHVLLWVRHQDFLPDADRASRWPGNKGDSRVDFKDVKGPAGEANLFNPAEPLTRCPLLLKHTAVPVQQVGRGPGGKKSKSVRILDQHEVLGENAPDAGALPEDSWWSQRAPPVLTDPTAHVEVDTEDEMPDVEDDAMRMVSAATAGHLTQILGKNRPGASKKGDGGDMAQPSIVSPEHDVRSVRKRAAQPSRRGKGLGSSFAAMICLKVNKNKFKRAKATANAKSPKAKEAKVREAPAPPRTPGSSSKEGCPPQSNAHNAKDYVEGVEL